MATQLEMPFPETPKRGGKRKGAGRKRLGRECVPHRARPRHYSGHPVLVTLRARAGLPSLRHAGLFEELRPAIRGASRSPAVGESFRVVEFSIQHDHVHLIVEGDDKDTLSRGVRGLVIRLARAVNRALSIRGGVWGDRYDARALKTPLAVRNALVYVLMNAKKHGERLASGVDRLSSARWFDGFTAKLPHVEESPVHVSMTWLGRLGWRRRGRIGFDERPCSMRSSRGI
jgi:putative transposase